MRREDEPGDEAPVAGFARALHLFTLSSFAVAQPLLDLLGRHPPFFVAHDSRPIDLVALAALLILLPPGLLLLVELAVGLLGARAGRFAHTVLVTLLAAATWLQALRGIGAVPGWAVSGASLGLGLATAVAYGRFPRFRDYLTWMSPAPLIFAVAFLFLSPVKTLVTPSRVFPPVDVELDAETPVVLLVFDELSLPTLMDPALGIDAQRFPHFAALAERSHWFRNATSAAEVTSLAIPQILTGRYLGEGRGSPHLATAEKHPRNLFTLLARSHRLRVFESTTRLCPRRLCARQAEGETRERLRRLLADVAAVYPHSVLPADLARDFPDVTHAWRDFGADAAGAGRPHGGRKPDAVFADFLAALRSGERRSLYFLHSSLPHMPWRFLPSGRSYGTPGTGLLVDHGLVDDVWGEDELAALQAFQRYLLQLRFTDRLLGEMVASLETVGLFDEALVVVTADHGVSFRPGQPRRRIAGANVQDVLPVPLFVKLPGQSRGAVSDRNVELVDVLPTIAEALGLPGAPWPTDGASAFASDAARAGKKVVAAPYDPDSFVTFGTRLDLGEAARRKARLLGPPERGPFDLHRLGPYSELLGQPLSRLQVAAEESLELRLASAWRYDAVKPQSGFVPARLVGKVRVREGDEAPLALAVAIDGTVQATTRTLGAGRDGAPFAVMVPESAFSPGRCRVEVFVVSGPPGEPRLIPVPLGSRPS